MEFFEFRKKRESTAFEVLEHEIEDKAKAALEKPRLQQLEVRPIEGDQRAPVRRFRYEPPNAEEPET